MTLCASVMICYSMRMTGTLFKYAGITDTIVPQKDIACYPNRAYTLGWRTVRSSLQRQPVCQCLPGGKCAANES